MKNMTSVEQLIQKTQALHAAATTEFASLSLSELNYKTSPESWSILECLEHLNRYSRYYNPVLAKAITANSDGPYLQEISYSWLGRKSLEMVHPDNMKKHKTVRHMNPNNSNLGHEVISEFLNHQAELLALLSSAKTANLSKKAVPVEFFRLLKLKIGEALEFVVLHELRHVEQAKRVKQQVVRQAA